MCMSNNSEISNGQLNYFLRENKKKKYIKFMQILILVIFCAVWEISARTGIIDPFIFSQPSRILNTLKEMILSGLLFKHLGITIFETLLGFSLGMILGILIAVILWWNSTISKILEPYLVVLNSLPKTALAPILIVWLGNNMKSIIAVALLTNVIVTVLNVLNGFLEVDEDKIKLIKTFGGTKKQILFKVVLPSSVPTIISTVKVNIGLSFVGVMVGEFLVASSGLGYLIVYGSQIFICKRIQIGYISIHF